MYCTVRDVRAALTPEADSSDTATGANLPDWQIADAIAEAETIVLSYVGRRYSVVTAEVTETVDTDPVTTITATVAPRVVRSWTRSLAAYLVALTFRKNKDLTEDDPIRLRQRMVMNTLNDVRDGRIDLPLPSIETESGGGGIVVNLYEGTLFGPDDFNLGPAGSAQSVNRLYDTDQWRG